MSKLRSATITLTVATTLTEEELTAAVEQAEYVELGRDGRFFRSTMLAADLMEAEA